MNFDALLEQFARQRQFEIERPAEWAIIRAGRLLVQSESIDPERVRFRLAMSDGFVD